MRFTGTASVNFSTAMMAAVEKKFHVAWELVYEMEMEYRLEGPVESLMGVAEAIGEVGFCVGTSHMGFGGILQR